MRERFQKLGSGWTGGQFSLFRVGLVGFLLSALPGWALAPAPLFVAVALNILLALGVAQRLVAVGLAALAVLHAELLWGAVCLLVALVPPRPYGAWAAHGRPDPAGGWRLPPLVALAAWLGASALAVHSAWTHLPFPVAGWSFFALLFDPAWLGRARDTSVAILFYDGSCGLCHRSVRFILAEDREGKVCSFAPLFGATFAAKIPVERATTLPDSLVVRTADEALLERSDAVVYLLRHLGGWWLVLGRLLWLVPRPLRNWAYDRVAAIRHHLFAKTDNACPLIPAELRHRFLP